MSTPSQFYQPQGEIARGGMGAVFHVVDAKLERSVAMKVMLRTRASEEEQWRFRQEARVLGQLAHPNIVPIHDLGTDEQGRLFYTMKLVQGLTLQEVITRLKSGDAEALARYPLQQLLAVFQKVCDGVAFAHSRGIIHRDLKPQNIMVGDYGEVLVMDWGLAKILPGSPAAQAKSMPPEPAIAPSTPPAGAPPSAPTSETAETLAAGGSSGIVAPKLSMGQPTPPPSHGSGNALTLAGRVMGTPHYMSPEQADGRVNELDERTDIFALGGILYALLTLRPPVDGASVEEMLAKARRSDITPPSALNARTGTVNTQREPAGEAVRPAEPAPLPHMPGGRVPPGLSAVAMKALAPIPANRYPTVAALGGDINAFQGGFATSAENATALTLVRLFLHRHKALAAAASLLVLLTLGFLLKLVASERLARASAELAGTKSEEALKEAARATEAEGVAVKQREAARKSLAQAKLALASAAYRELDGAGMLAALREVPTTARDTTWNYLFAKADSSIATFPAISSTDIHSIVPHPALPGVFAVSDRHHQLTLLDPTTGQRLNQFSIQLGTNRTTQRYFMGFSPDGERIAVVRAFNAGAVFRVADGMKLLSLPLPCGHRPEFSSDGKLLLIHSLNGDACMVDMATGVELWRSKAEGSYWAWMPGPQRVLKIAHKGELATIDALSGRPLGPVITHRRGASSIGISPNGKLVVIGYENGAFRGLNPDGWRIRFENRDAGWPISFVEFTADERWFVTQAVENDTGRQSLQVCDAQTGERVRSLLGGGGRASSLAIHPVSGEIAVASANSRLWRLPRYDARWRIENGQGPVALGAFWGSEDALFTQTASGPAKLVNMADRSTLWQAPDALFRVAQVSDNHQFAILSQLDGTVPSLILGDPANPRVLISTVLPRDRGELPLLSPDGSKVAFFRNQRVYVRDLATGKEFSFGQRNASAVRAAVWLSTNRLASSSFGGVRGSAGTAEALMVSEADSTNNQKVVILKTAVLALAAAPDGTRFAEAGTDLMIRIRDAKTLAVTRMFRAHDRSITSLAWHPSRPLLASASADLTVKTWNADSGQLVEELIGPTSTPKDINFSPSGARLACPSADRSVYIFDLARADAPLPPTQGKLIGEPDSPDGWRNLLGRLQASTIRRAGNGWMLNNDTLESPAGFGATVGLTTGITNFAYDLQVTVRQLGRDDGIAIVLPVAGRQTSFCLDAWPHRGLMSGFDMDRPGEETAAQPETVHARQVKDAQPHTLEFEVRPRPPEAHITVRMDGKLLTEWHGKLASLSISKQWKPVPLGVVGVGTHRGGWAVTGVKLRLPELEPE